jgi:hypothetical protein
LRRSRWESAETLLRHWVEREGSSSTSTWGHGITREMERMKAKRAYLWAAKAVHVECLWPERSRMASALTTLAALPFAFSGVLHLLS